MSNPVIARDGDPKQPKLDASMFETKTQPIHRPPVAPMEALVQLFCTSRLPFSIVNDPSLSHFVQAVRQDREWKLPHRTTLSGSGLTDCYNQVIAALKLEFEDCKFLALTVDGTTMHSTSYWSVTMCGLDQHFKMHVAPIACVPAYKNHSGKLLADLVKSTLEDLGLSSNKVVAICTDEGGGAPCIVDFFPNAEPIFCAAHILQTCLRNAFEDTINKFPELGLVIAFAKRLASIYNQSHIAKAENHIFTSTALSISVCTRPGCSYQMVIPSLPAQKHGQA